MSKQSGFHAGELAVQERAGVRAAAARLEGMVAQTDLTAGAARFLGERELVVLTGRDREGRLWTSPLYGERGFLQATAGSLHVAAEPDPRDPLHGLPAGQQVGLVAIDLATRRRLRVNGTLDAISREGLEVGVTQTFGNCPQYIQQRVVQRHPVPEPPASARRGLDATAAEIIRGADTFFLGTVAQERGVDSSHRGGARGFVAVDGNEVCWPDYPGNNLFNSLGNLAVDDTAALLFVDFTGWRALHVSGTARVEWTHPVGEGVTGRRVRFVVRDVVIRPVGLRAEGVLPYEHNPVVVE